MRIPSSTRPPSGDWVLQFINIVFLILIFFLANGTVSAPPLRDVVPPITIMSDTATVPQNRLYVSSSGKLVFDNRDVTLDEFIALAKQRRNASVLVADKRLPAVDLLDILMALRAEGLAEPAVITIRQPP
jgi:biopolymer transport protein ExbD